MRKLQLYFLVLLIFNAFKQDINAQFLLPSDSLQKSRINTILITGAVGYGTGMFLLGKAWYKNSLSSDFHFFNDNGEWMQIDKVGHVYSAYNESRIVFQMFRWAGVSRNKAMWLGIGGGALAQTSLEIFDGFSDKWGFSWGDVASNTLGLAAFGLQEHYWKDQRITFKVSSDFRIYDHLPITSNPAGGTDHLDRRAGDLYGEALPARLLKDYNAQTNWISINPASFSNKEKTWWPAFVNVAAGYSAENLYGGFGNAWSYNDFSYSLNSDEFPRYRQYILSLDIDFTRIPTRSPFLKTLFQCLNIFKVPAPALEYNNLNGMKWHWLFF